MMMNYKKELWLSIACFLAAFLCCMSGLRTRQENLAGRIAPQILRLHILANSNSDSDQSLKINVRDFLLEELKDEFFENTNHKEEKDKGKIIHFWNRKQRNSCLTPDILTALKLL